ncbi:MAG: TonB-dependent receptor [Bacteroidales bacterium]|nr:TonB-dependent receptor [Bacteroidales bacterium]
MKLKSLTAICFTLVLIALMPAVAQNTKKPQGRNSLTGKVIDSRSNEPLPYVSVALMTSGQKSSVVNGGITDDSGVFNIKNINSGNYILKLSFVGYKDVSKEITVNSANVNIGTVKLEPSSENLEEVTIVGAKQMMEYKLDKRVINVDQNLVSAGGNASDVLEDVPSVEVDDEGNISLRGASNVTLLIDGKPSTLYGNDVPSVLAQIPASQIDKIEVITNPSAKYNPEGMSGIINITLKEKGNMGLNGNINVASGTALKKWMPKESIAATLNWSDKRFSLSASADMRYDKRGMVTDNLRFFNNGGNDVTDLIRSKRDGGEAGLGGGFRLGGEWYINKYNTLSLNFNSHIHNTPDDYSTTVNQNLLKDVDERNNTDKSSGKNNGQFNNLGVTYQKEFKDKKDELFYAGFTWNWGKFNRKIKDEINYTDDSFADYYRGDTSESNNHRAVADVHFVYPVNENSKLEVGYNLNYSEGTSTSTTAYNGVLNTKESYDFEREEFIHAFYATYGFQIGKKLSAQLGLRQEIVNNDFKKTDFTGNEIKFDKDYNPLYPTVHISYQLNQMNSFQISYSRRIRRPDPWTMMPNIDRTNKEYLRFGNPDIDPEYTNAFEAGWSLMFKNTTIFTSAYYRYVSNGMTRFQFLWNEANAHLYGFDWAWAAASNDDANSITAQTFVNLAHSSNYGLEVIVDRDITNWWKANLSMNFFGSYQDGQGLGYDAVKSFNYNAKLNTTLTLPKNFTVQVSGRYNAPRKTIQGRDNARYDIDFAVKKSILNKQGNISLNFRDVLDTRGGFGYAYTDQYVSFTRRHPYSRSIRLSFSYNFGKTANMRRNKMKSAGQNDDSYSGSGENYDE